MLTKLTLTFAFILILASNSFAGIRSPGKHTGVVIYDRWDTCYLYSGVYLMHISQKTKDGLRQYEGKSVEIDAKDVFQPINPGDGVIGEYEFTGYAKPGRILSENDNLTATLKPEFNGVNNQRVIFELRNEGNERVRVSVSDLAMTLLGTGRSLESDGISAAYVTRQSMSGKVAVDGYYPGFLQVEDLPETMFYLNSQESRQINIYFKLSKGEYDFLCGYGGGVHEEKGIASNRISFNVDESGKAVLAETTALDIRSTNKHITGEAATGTFWQRLLSFFGLS